MSRFVTYRCKNTGVVANGFDDDFLCENWKERVFFLTKDAGGVVYDWEDVTGDTVIIHGDAGYMIEESCLDSVGTIHEATSQDLQQAEQEREAQSFHNHFAKE